MPYGSWHRWACGLSLSACLLTRMPFVEKAVEDAHCSVDLLFRGCAVLGFPDGCRGWHEAVPKLLLMLTSLIGLPTDAFICLVKNQLDVAA